MTLGTGLGAGPCLQEGTRAHSQSAPHPSTMTRKQGSLNCRSEGDGGRLVGPQGSSPPLSLEHTGLQTLCGVLRRQRALAENFLRPISLPFAAAPSGRCYNRVPSTLCFGGSHFSRWLFAPPHGGHWSSEHQNSPSWEFLRPPHPTWAFCFGKIKYMGPEYMGPLTSLWECKCHQDGLQKESFGGLETQKAGGVREGK